MKGIAMCSLFLDTTKKISLKIFSVRVKKYEDKFKFVRIYYALNQNFIFRQFKKKLRKRVIKYGFSNYDLEYGKQDFETFW